MTDPESPLYTLMPILMRFSAESATIRRLVSTDESFGCLVEDYLLAHNILYNLRNRGRSKPEPVEEHAMILKDLEGEISRFLRQRREEVLDRRFSPAERWRPRHALRRRRGDTGPPSQISAAIERGAHAILVLDRAGWHVSPPGSSSPTTSRSCRRARPN